MSSTESRIFDLIERWEAAQKEGQAPTPEELCAQCPELVSDVARRIKALQATAWMDKSVVPEPTQAQPHLTTVGRYELLEPIGKGGFAEVWKARDPELDRLVAIKIPRASVSFHAESFLEEARKVARLRHPGIVSVFDVGRERDQAFIVSELLAAGSLAERIKSNRPSHEEAVRLVSQIAEALHYAHQQGFIHRDIKPQNILIDENGNPKITDFGVALSETQPVVQRSRSAGTLAYMSPEQLQNQTDKIDARTDIYSLGVVLYESLTTRLPFVANDPMELWAAVVSQAPRTPRTIDRSIPVKLERLCLKAMAKNPVDRFSTAQDFADELRHLMTQPKQSSWAKGVFAPVFLALMIGGGGTVWWLNGQREPKNEVKEDVAIAIEDTEEAKRMNQESVERAKQQTETATSNTLGRASGKLEEANANLANLRERMAKLPALSGKTKTEQEASAELAVQMGCKALAEDDQMTALAEFNRAIELNARLGAGWHGRGVVQFNQAHYPEAVADLKKAVKLEPRKPEYFKNLAYALTKAGQHDEAVRNIVIGQAKTTPEERAEYKRFVAQIYDSRAAQRTTNGYHEGAVADLNEAIRWDDTYPDAFDDLGSIRFNLKQYEQAVEDFTKAIALAPDRPEFYVHRGHALRALSRNAEGQSDYESARRLEQAAGK